MKQKMFTIYIHGFSAATAIFQYVAHLPHLIADVQFFLYSNHFKHYICNTLPAFSNGYATGTPLGVPVTFR